MKKMRNSKQLSLKVVPLPGSAADNDSKTSLPMIVTPSLSTTPTSTSLLPLAASTSTGHRSISAYFSDYSLECGSASPYTSEPVCILPNLYLGAEHNALDVRTLKRLGITFVLNVAIEIAQESGLGSQSTKVNETRAIRGGVEFRSLAWTHHQKNLLHDFPAAFALIDEAVASHNGNGKALVHCQLGVSRSASLVIACVMRSLNVGLTEAYDFVKQKSSVISPNMSMMYQLAEFEKRLKNPESFTASASAESPSDAVSPSEHGRFSGCSQQDDDEPPYPFSAAFSAAASEQDAPVAPIALRSTDDLLPPATPIRH
ncbi:Dual specificity protein phosphatase 9, partial [Mortierella sp. GBA43]